jgi:pSer/pThr/pTyr-binding forkhead associated (FHA) protein
MLDKPQNDFSTRTGADTLFEPLDQNPHISTPSSPQRPDTATEVMSAISLTDPSVEKASISSELRRSKPDVGKTPLPAVQPPPPEPPRPESPVVDSSWSPSSRTETPGWEPRASSPIISSVKSPSKVDPSEQDRRTVFVADPSQPIRASKGRIVGWLVSYSHNPDGEDFRVYAGYNRIGANPVCDIVVEDDTVSGSHAIIVYRDGRCLIKDDLSRNGTFVNGREIGEAYPLQSYDQVRIGNTYLTFISAQRIA